MIEAARDFWPGGEEVKPSCVKRVKRAAIVTAKDAVVEAACAFVDDETWDGHIRELHEAVAALRRLQGGKT